MKFRKGIIYISCVAQLVLASSAQASNFSGATSATGCQGGVNVQDNSTMTYSRQSLTSGNYSAVAWVLNNDIAPTDIALAAEMTTPDSNTDVIYYDDDYSVYCGYSWHSSTQGGVIGLTVCVALSGSKCNQFKDHLDTSWTESNGQTWKEALVCHETGHTLGLLHNNATGYDTNGCMPSPIYFSRVFSPHDIVHINAFY